VLHFDRAVVKKVMIEDGRNKYGESDSMMDAFGKYDARLQPVLDAYLANRSLSDDFQVEGVNMRMIKDKFFVTFWEALVTMNSLFNDREGAGIIYQMKPDYAK
jgi:hypothetical protein